MTGFGAIPNSRPREPVSHVYEVYYGLVTVSVQIAVLYISGHRCVLHNPVTAVKAVTVREFRSSELALSQHSSVTH